MNGYKLRVVALLCRAADDSKRVPEEVRVTFQLRYAHNCWLCDVYRRLCARSRTITFRRVCSYFGYDYGFRWYCVLITGMASSTFTKVALPCTNTLPCEKAAGRCLPERCLKPFEAGPVVRAGCYIIFFRFGSVLALKYINFQKR